MYENEAYRRRIEIWKVVLLVHLKLLRLVVFEKNGPMEIHVDAIVYFIR